MADLYGSGSAGGQDPKSPAPEGGAPVEIEGEHFAMDPLSAVRLLARLWVFSQILPFALIYLRSQGIIDTTSLESGAIRSSDLLLGGILSFIRGDAVLSKIRTASESWTGKLLKK